MAGYSRPLSKGELRFIKMQRRRIIVWCGVVVVLVLTALIGVLWLMSNSGPH